MTKHEPADIKSSKRTLAIFELFAELRRPLRVNELHKRLDLPQSSVSKLLRNLSKLGYLQFDGVNRTYYPTLRVTLLGSWLNDQWFGHDSLLDTMESIRTTLGSSVLLGIQNDKHVLYMMALQALVQPRPPLSIGTLRPICLASVGKALLMEKSDQEIGLLVRRINAEETDFEKHVNLRDLLNEIEESRHRGYATSHGEVIPGVSVIAKPLRRIPSQPAMAIGVGAPLAWMEANEQAVVAVLEERIAATNPDRLLTQLAAPSVDQFPVADVSGQPFAKPASASIIPSLALQTHH